jgi:hypothetical protein
MENRVIEEKLNDINKTERSSNHVMTEAEQDEGLAEWKEFVVVSSGQLQREPKITFPVLVRAHDPNSKQRRTKRWGNGMIALPMDGGDDGGTPHNVVNILKKAGQRRHASANTLVKVNELMGSD